MHNVDMWVESHVNSASAAALLRPSGHVIKYSREVLQYIKLDVHMRYFINLHSYINLQCRNTQAKAVTVWSGTILITLFFCKTQVSDIFVMVMTFPECPLLQLQMAGKYYDVYVHAESPVLTSSKYAEPPILANQT